jgi:hypothetical protein
MPAAGIARQTRDLKTHDDPRAVYADLSDQLLKAFSLHSAAACLSLVTVDPHDLFQRPSQSQRPVPQTILTLAAFHVFLNLPQRRLS